MTDQTVPQPDEYPGPRWVSMLYAGVPRDDTEHERTTTIRGSDHPDAILLAVKAPALVAAWREVDQLPEVDSADLRDLLRTIETVRRRLASMSEHVITTWHERGRGQGSFREIAEVLGVHHTTLAERYGRMKAAHARDRTLYAEETIDPTLEGEQPFHLVSARIDDPTSGWVLMTSGTERVIDEWPAHTSIDRLLVEAGRSIERRYGRRVTWRQNSPYHDGDATSYTALID